MNTDTLLDPVSSDSPCGENLEYDADFMAMDQASQGKAEQQFGDTIIPAEPADWNKVEKLATGLLTRTKDLRVMMALTRAWTQLKGLPGYASGLHLINQSLQNYWDGLFPELWYDGEADPFFRINALAELGDNSSLTAAVRQSALLRSAADAITLRDAAALLDGSKAGVIDYPGGRTRLMDELAQGGMPGVEAVPQIVASLETLRSFLTEKLSGSGVPEMTQLLRTLQLVTQVSQTTDVTSLIPTLSDDAASQPEASAAPAVSSKSRQPQQDWRSVNLASRDDAQLMLEKVKQYFAQHEPSHPAPLMIERVQRMVAMDFMEIIRDLAPDGVHQLETIFGRRDN
ncbi:type VI secretion system protein ImpA [Erwinia toletana]|uniref:Type VI secretion system protein ImpA n=1 Tax=Winslowiella toletana TaxID=92490 RepID=A0ABS4P806_9GAMM|nr:type VI secretion system protein TssA [Winslowiella toletana]MBP2168779.1 type VI secretion system protein ImpA [Winslowiella toletana]